MKHLDLQDVAGIRGHDCGELNRKRINTRVIAIGRGLYDAILKQVDGSGPDASRGIESKAGGHDERVALWDDDGFGVLNIPGLVEISLTEGHGLTGRPRLHGNDRVRFHAPAGEPYRLNASVRLC